MHRNIKAGIKLFLRNFFDRFPNLVPPGFASHPESFEGNRFVIVVIVVVVVGT